MKAERLLELYDRISEAPDAVSRLRRFVLDLAVRGKLLEQDPEDEPASTLLARISAEKEKLLANGRRRKAFNSEPADESEPSFALPRGWILSRIEDLGVISPRNDAPDDAIGSFVPMPKIASEYGIPHQHEPRTWGEIKKGYTHFAEGDVGLAKITPCFENGKSTVFRNLTGGIGAGTTELHVLRPIFVNPDYVLLFLKSPHFIETGIPNMTGTAGQKRVPREYFANTPFPLPPLAEQHRIVAKVDELMALCDRLEEQHGTREATRDRLTTATLSRLTAPDTDEQSFRNHARFALDILPTLTTRPDQIKALRQTILDLAVRGKLVEQEPEDESATELFKRLSKAKEEAFAAEELRKRQPVSKSAQELGSVHTPGSWVQAKFDDVLVIVSGVTKGQKLSGHESIEANYMRVANVQRGFLDLSVVKKIKVRTTDVVRYRLECGDVLMTEGGDWDKLGRAAIWRGQISDCIHQNHVFRLRPPSPELLPEWVVLFANSAVGRSFFAEASKRTTNLASINMTQLRSCPLPLPPTSEQRRIVAKVDELMALCDRLEANLQQADHKRARLLESLLAEALTPAEAALEAA